MHLASLMFRCDTAKSILVSSGGEPVHIEITTYQPLLEQRLLIDVKFNYLAFIGMNHVLQFHMNANFDKIQIWN